jgi:hypothetical protein
MANPMPLVHQARGTIRNREEGTRAGWRPDLPDALQEPFIPILWVKVHELLGRVPEGSTARFVKDGTLPGEAPPGANLYRMAS